MWFSIRWIAVIGYSACLDFVAERFKGTSKNRRFKHKGHKGKTPRTLEIMRYRHFVVFVSSLCELCVEGFAIFRSPLKNLVKGFFRQSPNFLTFENRIFDSRFNVFRKRQAFFLACSVAVNPTSGSSSNVTVIHEG